MNIYGKKKQFINTTEASVKAAKKIAKLCVELGTVRRLIYTASVVSMSPMKDEGSGFKEFLDESCWTPLNLSYPFCNSLLEVPKTTSLTFTILIFLPYNYILVKKKKKKKLFVILEFSK